MRISDWSSGVCSSDLDHGVRGDLGAVHSHGIIFLVLAARRDLAEHGARDHRAGTGDDDRLLRGDVRIPHPADAVVATAAAVVIHRLQNASHDALLPLKAGASDRRHGYEIGKASCREEGCRSEWFSVVAGHLKKK